MTDNITNNDEDRKPVHSPAPWAWREKNGDVTALKSGDDYIFTAESEMLNYASSSRDYVDFDWRNGPANKALILAAPDLLEALQAVLKKFDPYATPGMDENVAAYEAAERAIAKALGQ